MARCLIVFDVSLCAEKPSAEIEQRLRMIPGVRDVVRLTAGSFQYEFKFYTMGDPFSDEENIGPIGDHIQRFFNNYIPGVSVFHVGFLQWLS